MKQPETKKTSSLFCPVCGSSAVDYSPLHGGDASCRICKHAAPRATFITYEFSHDFFTDENVFTVFVNEMKHTLLANKPTQDMRFSLGAILQKWGFVDAKKGRASLPTLMRYYTAIVRGAVLAVVEEREKIERERVQHDMGSPDVH